MIDDPLGPIDYEETGAGPTILLVPGSCSTGAAWRPVMSRLSHRYRLITTSLPGYGGTSERRTDDDRSVTLLTDAVEAVTQRSGCSVHLVGHSFGGLTGLAVALRGLAPLSSLTVLEAPAPGMLVIAREDEHYAAFRRMTDAYVTDYRSGNAEAVATMIDFYGGEGSFASLPAAVRAYAVKTTATNILDWETAYGFMPQLDALAALDLPVLLAAGGESHPAVIRANELLARFIPNAEFHLIDGAAHFMIATHPDQVAELVEAHISRAIRVNVRQCTATASTLQPGR